MLLAHQLQPYSIKTKLWTNIIYDNETTTRYQSAKDSLTYWVKHNRQQFVSKLTINYSEIKIQIFLSIRFIVICWIWHFNGIKYHWHLQLQIKYPNQEKLFLQLWHNSFALSWFVVGTRTSWLKHKTLEKIPGMINYDSSGKNMTSSREYLRTKSTVGGTQDIEAILRFVLIFIVISNPNFCATRHHESSWLYQYYR